MKQIDVIVKRLLDSGLPIEQAAILVGCIALGVLAHFFFEWLESEAS